MTYKPSELHGKRDATPQPKLFPQPSITRIQQQLDGGEMDNETASARIMDEVMPFWATSKEPVENLKMARDILSMGAQDEFTEAAVALMDQHGRSADQDGLQEGLRKLVLERSVLNLFWCGRGLYKDISSAFAILESDIEEGRNLKESPITKIMDGPRQLEYARRNKALKQLMHGWGDAIGEPITPDKLPVNNPAYSWMEFFTEDVFNVFIVNGALGMMEHSIDRGNPITEEHKAMLKKQLDKTPGELCAAGLILAEGSVLDKWGYYDPKTKSNYPRAVQKLNDGKEITLEEVSEKVRQKYPKASAAYTS